MRRNNAAEITLNKKLRLERVLYKEVAAIFRDITAKSGQPFHSVRSHQNDIELVLLNHYRRVFTVFGDDYRQENDLKLTEIQAAMLAADAGDVFEKRAKRQARIITDTNERQLAKTKRIAESQMSELLKKNPNLSFAKHSSDLYSAVLLRRVEAISIYETQWSAEFSKATEVSFLTRGRGVQTKAKPNVSNFKRWDSVGDDRVRDWHAEADGTVIPAEEPFEVNGEQLMYPGDESLGATASNIINCRCSVWYEIDEESLTGLVERDGNFKPTDKEPSDVATKEKFRFYDDIIDALDDWHSKTLAEVSLSDASVLNTQVAGVKREYAALKKKFNAGQIVREYELDKIGDQIADLYHAWSTAGRIAAASPKPLYEPTPVRVQDVPAGFETDHEVAMQRAEDEIVKVFGDKESMDQLMVPKQYRFNKVLNPQTHEAVREKITALNRKDYGSKLIESNGKPLREVLSRQVVPIDRMQMKDFFESPDPKVMSKNLDRAMTIIEDTFRDVTEVMAPNLYKEKMGGVVTQLSFNGGRAAADPTTNSIKAFMFSTKGGINEGELRFQIAHEFGHHIEFNNPAVMRRFQDWRKKRVEKALASGEQWKYDHDNEALLVQDGFYNKYISRVYDGGYTEALSMGVEALFDPYKFNTMLEKDPEHLKLVWATLRGY